MKSKDLEQTKKQYRGKNESKYKRKYRNSYFVRKEI